MFARLFLAPLHTVLSFLTSVVVTLVYVLVFPALRLVVQEPSVRHRKGEQVPSFLEGVAGDDAQPVDLEKLY